MPQRAAGIAMARMRRPVWCLFLVLALSFTIVSARRGSSSSGSRSSSSSKSSSSSTSTSSSTSSVSKPSTTAVAPVKTSSSGGLLSSTGAKVGTGLAAGAVAGYVAGKAFRVRRTASFPHYYYYYYGSRTSNQQCDGKGVICYRDYCRLGVSSCFNSTGAPAAVNTIMDGLNTTAMDAMLASNDTNSSTVNITAAALAASQGMPPLQLVPCPSSDYAECYTAERDNVVYVCNGRRTTGADGPVDAACGEALTEAEVSQLQAVAQATSSASLPLVSTSVALLSALLLMMRL